MSQSATTPRLAPAELRARPDAFEVVDVRTLGEFETLHLPGSHNHPLDELDERAAALRELVGAGRPVALICRSGPRAEEASHRLAEAGLGELPVVEGGVLAWEADGGGVVYGEQRWDLERQVRLVAGSLVAGSVALSVVVPGARFVAGAVGAGLVFAAATNTCTMARVLARLPYNRRPRVTEAV